MRKSNVIDFRSRNAYVYKENSYTLRDCLECCTQEDLEDIAYYQGLELPDKMKREALVNLLEPQILGDFARLMPFFLPEDIELLDMAVSGMPRPADELMMWDLYLYDLGYIYFFYENDRVHPVLPEEMLHLLKEALDGGLLEQLPFREEMADYAEALLNLYGIYEVRQLTEVWNAHHRKATLQDEEVWAQVTGMEDVLACYWCDEGLIVSDYFSDYYDVDAFMAMVKDLPYYMPSPEDIKDSVRDFYRMGSPEFQAVEMFVRKKKSGELTASWEVDNILPLILNGALFDGDTEALVKELQEEGFCLTDTEELCSFAAVYEQYRQNTRCWALRGYRPCDLPEEPGNRKMPLSPESGAERKPRLRAIRGGKK